MVGAISAYSCTATVRAHLDLDRGTAVRVELDHPGTGAARRSHIRTPSMDVQVVDRRVKQLRSILELAKSCVSVETEESTNLTTLVIMINMDGPRVATNGAHAILGLVDLLTS